jgi:hypothetical protein
MSSVDSIKLSECKNEFNKLKIKVDELRGSL